MTSSTRCHRCGREAVGWPLRRPDRCSPTDWDVCLREPQTVARENDRPRRKP